MSVEKDAQIPEMDVDELYREDTFTDRRVGSIRRLTPVSADGSEDASRPVIYVGQTQMMTPAGTLPLNFEIDAQSLGEAAQNFPAAAQDAVDRTIQELEDLRREAASSIVLPEAGGGALGGVGGLPGGGKIHMP